MIFPSEAQQTRNALWIANCSKNDEKSFIDLRCVAKVIGVVRLIDSGAIPRLALGW